MLTTMVSIWRAEGVQGLFRGNGASVMRIVPYSSIHFGLYENFRRFIVKISYQKEMPMHVSPIVDLLAGSASGATAVLITYPLDLVRTRLAYISEYETRFDRGSKIVGQGISLQCAQKQTIRSILRGTLEKEGLRGLYHGIGPSLYGILPYSGLKFFVYQHLKQYYWKYLYVPIEVDPVTGGRSKLPVAYMLVFGGIAGLIAQTVTYPLDVVRRRMQVEGMKAIRMGGEEILPRSTLAALWSIARQEGFHALFSGLSINYMKVVPSTAIGFSCYDFLKSALELPSNI